MILRSLKANGQSLLRVIARPAPALPTSARRQWPRAYSSTQDAEPPEFWQEAFDEQPVQVPRRLTDFKHDNEKDIQADAKVVQEEPPLSDRARRRRVRAARLRRLREKQLDTDPGPDGRMHLWKWRSAPPDEELRTMSTTHLNNLLDKVAGIRYDGRGALRIVKELIGNRGEMPNVQHYKAMILANCDAAFGSAEQVRWLLREMEANGIPADSATLHGALRALAIHPDYVLRRRVLQMLRERWIPLSPAGWHHVLVGYLREDQYEMALHTLERMEAHFIACKEWVFGLLLYHLCKVEEFDTILDLMKLREEWGGEISPTVWYYLLDQASEALHVDLTKLIWKRRVETGLINPSYGVCDNVLRTTARFGDTELAESVLQVLRSRHSPISIEHYDALIDTYITAGDLESAMRALCQLAKMTLFVPKSSTRPIMHYMIMKHLPPQDVWDLLKTMAEREKLSIPSVAANLVFELCARGRRMTVAMALYKEYHTLVPAGPDTTTFNHCIHGCRLSLDPEYIKFRNQAGLASWFIKEMIQLKILPDRGTYEELVLLCVTNKQFHEAYMYFQEMHDNGFELSELGKTTVRTLCNVSDEKHAKLMQYHTKVRPSFEKGLTWLQHRDKKNYKRGLTGPSIRKIDGGDEVEVVRETGERKSRTAAETEAPPEETRGQNVLNRKEREEKTPRRDTGHLERHALPRRDSEGNIIAVASANETQELDQCEGQGQGVQRGVDGADAVAIHHFAAPKAGAQPGQEGTPVEETSLRQRREDTPSDVMAEKQPAPADTPTSDIAEETTAETEKAETRGDKEISVDASSQQASVEGQTKATEEQASAKTDEQDKDNRQQ